LNPKRFVARQTSDKPRVFVTRRIADEALSRLASAATVDLWDRQMPPSYRELVRRIRDVDAVLSMVTDCLDARAIRSAPRLRAISNLAVGVDNIDLAAATSAGIAVGHTPGILTETTADAAFALLLAAARRIAEGDRMVRSGRWRTWGPRILLGRDVHRATLGIIGFGAIGRAVARRAAGFDMCVLYTSRGKPRQRDRSTAARRVTLERLLRESDFVSIHVALTPATRRMLGAREFASMKRGAIVINTARGGVIDQQALARAIASGHLAGAGLDVTEPEPIARGDPLLRLPTVVITPHIASASHATRARMADIAVENILATLAGRVPPFCANPTVRLRKMPAPVDAPARRAGPGLTPT
jgi:glyoxylate reductase